MNINLVSKNMEITDPIRDYVIKKVTDLGKLLNRIEEEGGEVKVNFEVSRSTQHHKSGEVFHADCNIDIGEEHFYLSADKEDMYSAIDAVKDGLFREIRRSKNKKQDLFKRGARKAKSIFRGINGK